MKFRVLALLLLLQACPTVDILLLQGTLLFDDFPGVSAVAYVLLAFPYSSDVRDASGFLAVVGIPFLLLLNCLLLQVFEVSYCCRRYCCWHLLCRRYCCWRHCCCWCPCGCWYPCCWWCPCNCCCVPYAAGFLVASEVSAIASLRPFCCWHHWSYWRKPDVVGVLLFMASLLLLAALLLLALCHKFSKI